MNDPGALVNTQNKPQAQETFGTGAENSAPSALQRKPTRIGSIALFSSILTLNFQTFQKVQVVTEYSRRFPIRCTGQDGRAALSGKNILL